MYIIYMYIIYKYGFCVLLFVSTSMRIELAEFLSTTVHAGSRVLL